jgi:integrase
MAASLIDPTNGAREVVRSLKAPLGSLNIGSGRPRPVEMRAAQYLRAHFLPPHHEWSAGNPLEMSADIARGAEWIAAHSKGVGEVRDVDLLQLRIDLGGEGYQTDRKYWAIVEAVLHWRLETGRLDHDPSVGLPKIRRVLDAESVVPDRVPDETEVWEIADAGRATVGEWFGVAVLLAGYGALRAGELVALRPRDLGRAESGGLWLTIGAQHRRFARRHSDDGVSTHDYAPPKGRVAGASARRRCYIPTQVATEIWPYLDERSSADLLFETSRGRAYGAGTFRSQWNRVIGM